MNATPYPWTGHIGCRIPDGDATCDQCEIFARGPAKYAKVIESLTGRPFTQEAKAAPAPRSRVSLKIVGSLCKHFGPALDDIPGCKICGFDGKVHACTVHSQCTTLKVSRRWPSQTQLVDVMACEDCTQGERR